LGRADILASIWTPILAPAAARAPWIPRGPFGGAEEIVPIVPQQPNFVVAATANGLIYQSQNGGASWSPLRSPARFAGVLHPEVGNRLADARGPGRKFGAASSVARGNALYGVDDDYRERQRAAL
jgi:hypothetical protein